MIKIALLGFGNVGRAFARYLYTTSEGTELRILGVADVTGALLLAHVDDVRWLLEKQEQGYTIADCAERGTFFEVPAYIDALRGAGIAVLVECLPTNPNDGQPALDLIRRALDNQVAVVTVDKGPIVHGFQVLRETAQRRGTKLAYSGTTGVRPPAELVDCDVLEIRGILNGTTNYILTEMQEHELTFRQALAQARQQGIAEPNPSLDIEGWDTACKILILANEWMDARATLGDVLRAGIGPQTEELVRAARDSGRAVRLVGRARRWQERVRLSVAPKIVGPESILHSISGTSKGAVFKTKQKGEIFAGSRSGREAIAAIILEDIKAILQ
jgi:homoserine dehydrogenase